MGSNRCGDCRKFAIVYCECSKQKYCDFHFYKHVDQGDGHEVKYLIENNADGLTDIESDERDLQKSGFAVSGVKFPVCDLAVGSTQIFTAEKDGVYMRPKEGFAVGKQFLTYFSVWSLDLNDDHNIVVAGLDTNEICVFNYLLSTEPVSIFTKSGPISSVKLFHKTKSDNSSFSQIKTNDLLVASGSNSGDIEIYLLSTTGITQVFSEKSHEKPVVSIAVSSSSRYLITGCTFGLINIFDQNNGFQLTSKLSPLKSSIVSIRISESSEIFTATLNGEVSVGNIEENQLNLIYSHNDQIFNMQIDSPGCYFYISDANYSIFKVTRGNIDEKLMIFTYCSFVRSFVLDCSSPSETLYLVVGESELTKTDIISRENKKISPSRLILTKFFGKASQYLLCGYEDEETLIFDVSTSKIMYNYSSVKEVEEGLNNTFKNK
jgi:WD40 repeat protein